MAAYQPKGAASYAASKIDLSGNGNNATEGVAPGWNAAQGWIFTGIEWLDTGVIPAVGYSMLIQFVNQVRLSAYICGAWGVVGGINFALQNWRAGNVVRYVSGNGVNVAPQLVTGNLGIAGTRGYRNGVAEGAAMTGNSNPGTSIYIGTLNQNGVVLPGNNCIGDTTAMSIYSCTLTPAEMAAVTAWMAAL